MTIKGEKKNLSDAITKLQEEIDGKNSVLNEITLELVISEERKSASEKSIAHLKDENQNIETEITKLKEETQTRNLTELNEIIEVLKEKLDSKEIKPLENPPETKELIENDNQETAENDIPPKLKKIRFVHPVPSFIWTDLQEYGPFEEGEETEIFEEVADLIIEKGRAEEVK